MIGSNKVLGAAVRGQLNRLAHTPGTFAGHSVQSKVIDLSYQKENYFNALKQYPNAEVLILSHTLTTGMNLVRANRTLKTLLLGYSNVNNIRAAKGLKALETLDISYTPTIYLDPLEGSRALKNLFIAGSNVRDIRVAFGIKTLKTLIIHEGQISAHQLYKFRKAVPGCEVTINKYRPTAKMKAAAKGPEYKELQKMVMPWHEDFIEDPGKFNPDEG